MIGTCTFPNGFGVTEIGTFTRQYWVNQVWDNGTHLIQQWCTLGQGWDTHNPKNSAHWAWDNQDWDTQFPKNDAHCQDWDTY